MIEAERGHGYRGDSALDDVKVTNTPCSAWAEWSNWGLCSKTCGGGIRQRNRQCFLRNKAKCNGKFKEEETCNMHTCGGWSCNFNSGLCGMKQSTNDDFDWERKSGYTPSAMTGPTHDVSGNGYYMYIEGSSPQKTGDIAILKDRIKIIIKKFFSIEFRGVVTVEISELLIKIYEKRKQQGFNDYFFIFILQRLLNLQLVKVAPTVSTSTIICGET